MRSLFTFLVLLLVNTAYSQINVIEELWDYMNGVNGEELISVNITLKSK